MTDSSGKNDLEQLMSHSDDIAQILRDSKDVSNFSHCLQLSQALQFSCDSDSSEVNSLLQDYQRKIDECKEKTEAARCEVVGDAELDQLEKELHEELEKEHLLLKNMR
ncbi:hypothetical protein SAY87_009197 [Trapa incisa]|uniref:Uncharacterized protein n=1 Tax=Trapa incisa TaxID=236973 RepID=A0AAN7JZN2_9MYRT|nr:hypothetical protein SAY87_009197 [Trapa incisa]